MYNIFVIWLNLGKCFLYPLCYCINLSNFSFMSLKLNFVFVFFWVFLFILLFLFANIFDVHIHPYITIDELIVANEDSLFVMNETYSL